MIITLGKRPFPLKRKVQGEEGGCSLCVCVCVVCVCERERNADMEKGVCVCVCPSVCVCEVLKALTPVLERSILVFLC